MSSIAVDAPVGRVQAAMTERITAIMFAMVSTQAPKNKVGKTSEGLHYSYLSSCAVLNSLASS